MAKGKVITYAANLARPLFRHINGNFLGRNITGFDVGTGIGAWCYLGLEALASTSKKIKDGAFYRVAKAGGAIGYGISAGANLYQGIKEGSTHNVMKAFLDAGMAYQLGSDVLKDKDLSDAISDTMVDAYDIGCDLVNFPSKVKNKIKNRKK